MSHSRKSSAILGLSQYSDSDASGQESDDGDESNDIDENPHNSSVNNIGDAPRVPAIASLTSAQVVSNQSSPSNIFVSSIPRVRLSPEPQVNHKVADDFPLDEEDRPTSPVSFHKTLEGVTENEIMIPPEPPSRCVGSVIDKMRQLKDTKDKGADMVSLIQKRKDFRNPSIYEKLIVHCGIDEFGTNFAPEFYDPHKWSPESYYESLSTAQKLLMDKREIEKCKSTKVEIVVGTAKKPAPQPENHHHSHLHQSSTHDGSRKRSKWDVPAGGSTQKPLIIPPITQVSTSKSSSVAGYTLSKKK